MKIYEYVDNRRTMYLTIIVISLIALILVTGILTPLIVQLTTGSKINLTVEYFNTRVALPAFALVVLLGICMTLNYFKSQNILIVTGVIIVLSIVSATLNIFGDLWLSASLPIFIFALIATLFKLTKLINLKAPRQSLRNASPHVIHLGIMLILIGVVLSTTLAYEDTKSLTPGSSWDLKKYTIKVKAVTQDKDSYSTFYLIDLEIYKDGNFLDQTTMKLSYDMRWIDMFEQGYSKAYIKRLPSEDLFIAIKGLTPGHGTGIVTLYAKVSPAISLIWIGLLVMAAGIGIIAGIERVPVIVPEVKVKKKDIKSKYEARFQAELRKRGKK